VHAVQPLRLVHEIRARRRDRRLAAALERRVRTRLDARVAAAARLVDELRRRS
jgi:hypothetical protein